MTRDIVHASRMGIAKAGSADGGVHRLEDIEVQEVSLVDRPANKRAFLIVKRSDEMTTQVQPDGKGGFTAAGGVDKAGAPPPMPPGGAPPAAGAPAAGAPPKKKPGKVIGKLDVPPGFKEMMGPMLAKAAESLSTLADAVDKSTPQDIGDDGEMPAVPAEFSSALSNIMGTLDKLQGMWPSSGDSEGPSDAGDPAEATEGEPPTDMQMRAALDNVGKVLGNPKVTKAAIAKVGAKMAKDRFARLTQAAQTLTSLIGELAPTMAPAGAPAAGAPALGKSATAKGETDILKAIETMLTPVIDGLNKVGIVVKQQRDEFASIQKSRGGGNAARVEKSGGAAPAEAPFSWPLDLNKPVTKETVSKTESFFGTED